MDDDAGRRDREQPDDPAVTMTCSFCGRREPVGGATLAWTTGVERGRPTAYCTACSRTNLRSIEGKLDREYW